MSGGPLAYMSFGVGRFCICPCPKTLTDHLKAVKVLVLAIPNAVAQLGFLDTPWQWISANSRCCIHYAVKFSASSGAENGRKFEAVGSMVIVVRYHVKPPENAEHGGKQGTAVSDVKISWLVLVDIDRAPG